MLCSEPVAADANEEQAESSVGLGRIEFCSQLTEQLIELRRRPKGTVRQLLAWGEALSSLGQLYDVRRT